MATLQENLLAVFQQIGADMGMARADIHALQQAISTLPALNALIDDAATASTTDKTWSAQKLTMELAQAVAQAVAQAKADIVNGAPTAYDTLLKIADYVAHDQNTAAALLQTLNACIRVDQAQTLSAAEQEQAQLNLGITGAGLLESYLTARGA